NAPPSFAIVLPLPRGSDALAQARLTLASLANQAYTTWRLHVVTRTPDRQRLRLALLDGFEDQSERVELLTGDRAVGCLYFAESTVSHLMLLRPGDELGCDALLEFAVQATLHP